MMIANRVMALGRGDKIAGDKRSTLVNKLVKGMLTVVAGLAPYHRTGSIVQGLAIAVSALAVALHIALLQVGCKTVQVLVVWKYGLCL